MGNRNDARAAFGAILVLTAAACSADGVRKPGGGGSDGGAAADSPPATATAGAGAKGTATPGVTAYVVAVKTSTTGLRTFGTGTNECADLEATVTAGGNPAADVEVSFKAEAKGTQKDKGEANPEKVKTDAAGVAKSKVCSGKDEGAILVKVTAGVSTANTAEIKVTSVPSYRFSWKDTKVKSFAQRARDLKGTAEKYAELLALAPEDTDAVKPMALSLRGGGSDCSFVEFELTRDGIPASGEKIIFQTQEEYPVGVKLAKREAAGLTKVNSTTGKKYAYYDGTSNADGVFQIPLCAGSLPGNVILSATYTETDGKGHEVKSPLVVMAGGVTNYGFMSLTFDPANARVVPADTFTNTQKTLPFIARLGTLNDGTVIKSYPLSVIAELGKVIIDNNGFPDDTGQVKFTYEALNTRGRRPYMKDRTLPDLRYDAQTGYSACEPLLFTPTGSGGTGPVPYSTLAGNWRSTLVYYVRGAEFHQINNVTGLFDASKAFGFWDVNQNGTYDGNFVDVTSIDKITFVPAGRTKASFNIHTDDWFLDLPGPYVDANESGAYDVGEPIIGDEYSDPNGKYDDDSYIWKSVVLPLNLGATMYSLQHSRISSVINDFTASDGWTAYHQFLSTNFGGTPYRSNVALTDKVTKLFGVGPAVTPLTVSNPTGVAGIYDTLYFHAQDKCGNPLPGGKKITTAYVVDEQATFGPRGVTTEFHVQPYDSLREPSKRLLQKATGSSDAVVNADILDHPAAKASYPIEFQVRINPCTNRCTGDMRASVANNPPVYCAAEFGHINLDIEGDIGFAHGISIPEVFDSTHTSGQVTAINKCGCAAGASLTGSACACPSGTIMNTGGTACVPPP